MCNTDAKKVSFSHQILTVSLVLTTGLELLLGFAKVTEGQEVAGGLLYGSFFFHSITA